MGGKWYILVIVDDYSRYYWVFFLESKDKVLEHFQSLAFRLNNEYPNCLKAICSDNGAEFRNASFNQFCLEYGVNQDSTDFFLALVPSSAGALPKFCEF
jgi:transposase InsO family protein